MREAPRKSRALSTLVVVEMALYLWLLGPNKEGTHGARTEGEKAQASPPRGHVGGVVEAQEVKGHARHSKLPPLDPGTSLDSVVLVIHLTCPF